MKFKCNKITIVIIPDVQKKCMGTTNDNIL
jgi:hypothetical protein